MISRLPALILLFSLLLAAPARAALDATLVAQLAAEDSDEKIAAIWALARGEQPEEAVQVLQALADGSLKDAGGEEITINNRIRGELAGALASLRLFDADRGVRLAAAKELQSGADAKLLGVLDRALEKEDDADIRRLLSLVHAQASLQSEDAKQRLAALQALAAGDSPNTKSLLAGLLAKNGADWAEPDAEVRRAAAAALKSVESRLATAENVGRIFSGLSLGSILLLAALGLAITYGVMGVINMAHGEMVMIGAYVTFVVQEMIRSSAPALFDLSLLIALPLAFLTAGAVGVAIERGIIRLLYGRPLETLLATWGVSLCLQQAVRSIFGPTNREVGAPGWMSGAFELGGLTLTYGRAWIIVFALLAFAALVVVLRRTAFGLQMRAVTQNRRMASSMGIRTTWVDALTFGLGSGVAGVAGVALSQLANVGPNLGQAYIIDSFMVVVFGGVGQLAGTVLGAMGLGIVNKILEPQVGAVLGKIAILVFIILFIQKRPQGLFALKGRQVD